MNRKDLIALLRSVGVNVTYGWYEQAQIPKRPFLVLYYLYSDDFAADDIDYLPRSWWQLDLVTDKRDESLETKVEQALRNGGLRFSKTADIDAADERHRMIYRFRTLGG